MKIHIPTPLRAYTDKQETVNVSGATVAAGLQSLVAAYPPLRQHLFTPEGKLRSFVNVYLRDEDVRYLPEKEETPVTDADEVTIIPSIAGGLNEASGLEAVRYPNEGLKHAHMLLAQMTPEQLLKATLALEDVLDGAVYVTSGMVQEDEVIDAAEESAAAQGRADLAAGRTVTMEEVLAERGLTYDDLHTSKPAAYDLGVPELRQSA